MLSVVAWTSSRARFAIGIWASGQRRSEERRAGPAPNRNSKAAKHTMASKAGQASGHDDPRDHEGHRLAATLGPRARKKAGLTQHDVAKRLRKQQSFAAKGGERRIDVVEFIAIMRVRRIRGSRSPRVGSFTPSALHLHFTHSIARLAARLGRSECDPILAKSATRLLGIRSTSRHREHVWWPRRCRPMDLPPETIETTIKVYLSQMRARLDEAASIATAAEACADTGNFSKGIEIALDVEQLLYEVNTFLNAASLIHRLGKSQ